MLELSLSEEGDIRLERYAIATMPKEAVADGNIAKPELVESAMYSAWQAMRTRTRDIVLALPAAAVITKKIMLPQGASEADIEAQVRVEVNQLAPFPQEEVSLDYQILGPSSRGDEDEALIVVSRRERLEERVALAEAVGLNTVIVDVDSFAALNAYEQIAHQLPDEGRNLTVAIIDIGANTTHVNIVHDHELVYQREHTLGGRMLTQEIVRYYGMSFEEAEQAKREGLLPENYDSALKRPFFNAVASEIGRALQLFYSATAFSRVDYILLAGGCAAMPGLDAVVQGWLQISTMVANPFAKMVISHQVKAHNLAVDAPALFVACGLALRRFDP